MDIRKIDGILKNNSGIKSKETLINSFVIREKPFKYVLSDLEKGNNMNHLIIGQRGAGKTTLLHRIGYAIEDNLPNLFSVMLNEEQYNLSDLQDLWELIAEVLDDKEYLSGISRQMRIGILNELNSEEVIFQILLNRLNNEGKSLIVFIENIDVFFKKIGSEGQNTLRSRLDLSANIFLIGSSTSYFDAIIKPGHPFFGFFHIQELDGLDFDESVTLLKKLAELSGESRQIDTVIERSPKRIESLRKLTAGNPRTIAYLFQIFLDNENGKAILDLYKVLDDITFLYKAELDYLSTQQQKLVDAIARNWDAVSTKELVARTKIDSKQVASILLVLERNQLVESIQTNTKNKLYRLKDRFLNIWYLMRFGRKRDQENVVWLVRFYDAWCDTSELSKRISKHIDNLKLGRYDVSAAVDMGNTFLSCENVPPGLKYNLYKTTVSLLPREQIKELKHSGTIYYDAIRDIIKVGDLNRALELINEMPQDENHYLLSHYVNFKLKNYSLAGKQYEMYFELRPDSEVAYRVADFFNLYLFDHHKAKHYFSIALTLGNYTAAYKLGCLFQQGEDLDRAIEYHRIALKNNINESLLPLVSLYSKSKRFTEAKQLCLAAIDSNIPEAYNALAQIEHIEGNVHRSEEILLKAISNGNTESLLALGNLYLSFGKDHEQLAIGYLEKAAHHNIHQSYGILGKYYLEEKGDLKKAMSVLGMGIELQDAESAHLLAHHYVESEDWTRGESYFIKAIEWGKPTALLCLSTCAFYEKRNDRKEMLLELFNKNIDALARYPFAHLEFLKIQLWNSQNEVSKAGFLKYEPILSNLLTELNEDIKERLIGELTEYMLYLIAKNENEFVLSLFNTSLVEYRQILKPVYFALMKLMADEYPNEYLKAGKEITDTVSELIEEINYLKN